jgi:superoxide reductase
MKFYRCDHCGNVISFVKDQGVSVQCCGQKMRELTPNTTDAAVEKHVPVILVEGNEVTVTISTVQHPMAEEHYIEWVALETQQGSQLKALQPGQAPEVSFMICEGDQVVAAYAYCNLHGLWKGTV